MLQNQKKGVTKKEKKKSLGKLTYESSSSKKKRRDLFPVVKNSLVAGKGNGSKRPSAANSPNEAIRSQDLLKSTKNMPKGGGKKFLTARGDRSSPMEKKKPRQTQSTGA